MARTRGKTRRYGKTTPAASRRPPAPLDSHVRSFMVMGPAPPASIRTRSDRRSGRRVRQLAWRERPSLLLQFVVPRSRRVQYGCQIRCRLSFVSLRILSRIRCPPWIPTSSVVFSRVLPRHMQAASATSTQLLHASRPVVATLAAVPFTSMDGRRQRVRPTMVERARGAGRSSTRGT